MIGLKVLQEHLDFFVENDIKIVNYWLDNKNVINVLTSHNIDIDYFKSEFAIKILHYFIDVIKEEKEAGNCPVVSILIDYMYEHGMSSGEIFTICTNAKKSTLDLSIQTYGVTDTLIDGIYELFDINFNGVLEYYESINNIKKDEAISLSSSLKIRLDDALQEIKNKDTELHNASKINIMSEMISMIAHQWRQPLSAISLLVSGLEMQSMMEEIDKDEVRNVVQKVNTKTKELSALIENFSKLFSIDKNLIDIDINLALEKSLKLNLELLSEHSIKYSLDSSLEYKVFGSESKLMQVFYNIILNAIEAIIESKTTQPVLKIIAGDDDDTIFIKIVDNGGGISDKIESEIYDAYFSTKSKNSRGLGLYMTKIAIENQFGGELYHQNVDNGVEFIIEIPINNSDK